jgi:hypothetical protein
MNFHFPDHRVLCMAENCTCTMHNLYTPRGAQVRDALAWSKYLQEAIDLYADTTDVCFASHHWPRWGAEDIVGHLARQRDTYRFLHDQTLRLANHGHTSMYPSLPTSALRPPCDPKAARQHPWLDSSAVLARSLPADPRTVQPTRPVLNSSQYHATPSI